ncbi:MAG: hypothetical protein FH749_08995 [Firmicutes bacterium]|nr:hypothetical protein [Bacillota bacterium]
MKSVYQAGATILLVLLQGSFLPVFLPRLPVNAALVFLVLISFTAGRNKLLGFALLAGLVQDVLYGEITGMFMLMYFVSAVALWELKTNLLVERVYMCGLRLAVATLVQDLTATFIFYMNGMDSGQLLATLQFNAGINLLANLGLLLIVLALFRVRGKASMAAVLGENV